MSVMSRKFWSIELIHRDYSEESLKLATIWVFLIWLVKVLTESMPTIAMLPYSVYEPLGMIRFVPASLRPLLLTTPFLEGLRGLLVASLLAVFVVMLLDIRALRERRAGEPRPEARLRSELLRLSPAICACLLITLYEGVFRGYAGHISHEDTLLLYSSYFLAGFPIANLIARRSGRVDSSTNLNAIPVISILFTLCLIYTVVATYRVIYGAPDVFTNDSLTFWTLRNSIDVLDPGVGLGFSVIDRPWIEVILLAGFPVVTFLEFTAPLILVSVPFRRLWLFVMIPFHIMSWMYMDVLFKETLALYLLLIDPVTVKDFLVASLHRR